MTWRALALLVGLASRAGLAQLSDLYFHRLTAAIARHAEN